MNNRIDYQKIGKKYGINVMFGTVLKEETPHVIMIRCKGRIKPNIRKKNYEDGGRNHNSGMPDGMFRQ